MPTFCSTHRTNQQQPIPSQHKTQAMYVSQFLSQPIRRRGNCKNYVTTCVLRQGQTTQTRCAISFPRMPFRHASPGFSGTKISFFPSHALSSRITLPSDYCSPSNVGPKANRPGVGRLRALPLSDVRLMPRPIDRHARRFRPALAVARFNPSRLTPFPIGTGSCG